MNNRRVLGVCLFLPLSFGMLVGQAPNWQEWSKKDAEKVVEKATEASTFGFRSVFLGSVTAAVGGGIGKSSMIFATWLTDDVCWALARIIQIEERRTDQETVARHASCRDKSETHYAITVSAMSLSQWRGGRVDFDLESTDTQAQGQMFLQQKKNRQVFLRPAEIQADHDGTILLFPRDRTFLDGQKEIQFEMVQDGNRKQVTFKIKDLVKNGKLEDL